MAERLPVGETINEAFQFGLHRWGAIIRFAWAPAAVSIILLGLYAVSVIDLEAARASSQTPQNLAEVLKAPVPLAVAGGLAVYALSFLLFSGAIASLFRLVALGEERKGFFHLRLDGPAWRVFWAYFILGALGLAISIVALLIGASITGAAPFGWIRSVADLIAFSMAHGEGATPPADLTNVLVASMKPLFYAFLIGIIPTIYLNVKLAPFPAASAAENRLVLFGSFAMTFGRAWSIFFVYVLFFVAIVLLSLIFGLVSNIIELLAKFMMGQGGALAIIGSLVMFAFFVVSIIFQAFVASVQYSLPAIIYRRLKTGE
ncbi:MAG: hypothetical protein Kow00133_13490 [Amphiplicatus sp.]